MARNTTAGFPNLDRKSETLRSISPGKGDLPKTQLNFPIIKLVFMLRGRILANGGGAMRRLLLARRTRRWVSLAAALQLAGAAGLTEAARAGPETEPDPRPLILGCYGGEMGVGRGGTTRACRSEKRALWFFMVPQADRRRALDVVYRFDVFTREMEPLPVAAPTVSEPVREAWETFRDESSRVAPQRTSRWSVRSKKSLHRGGRRYELEERAILVQQGLDFRLHTLPWPSWADVDSWLVALEGRIPYEAAPGYLREVYGDRPPAARLGPHAESDGRLFFGLQGGFADDGAFGGLAIFDLDAESWHVLRPSQLLAAAVTDVLPDPNRGTLWIGSRGLLRFDLQDCTWDAFTTENSGIAGDTVWWLRWTPDGIWISTENGLSRFDLEDESFRNFLWSPASEGSSPLAFELMADAPSKRRTQEPRSVRSGRVVAGVAPPGTIEAAERQRRAARSCWISPAPGDTSR
jgi:hypothetical protein